MSITLKDLMKLEVAAPLSFEPLPVGEYTVTVDDCELGTSQAGNPMYTVDFIVNDGEHEGRSIRYWQTLTMKERLHWLLPAFCEAATGKDFPEPQGRTPAYFAIVAEKLVGRTATIVVAQRKNRKTGEVTDQTDVKKVEWDKAKPKKRASKIKL